METPNSAHLFRIGIQSALAAAFCLGLPAGLLMWLILLRQVYRSDLVDKSILLLQTNGLNKIILLAVCSLIWGFLLARISGYRLWWKIGLATSIGIIVAWFLPLSNMDAWFREGTPVHIVYAAAMCGIVMSTTICVGVAYGLILRNIRASLILAFTTSLVSAITLLLTIIVFDRFGIRVGGTVSLAMSKVTVTGLLMSAITGGVLLGVGFNHFAENNRIKQNSRRPFESSGSH